MISVIKHESPQLSAQRKCEIAGIARSSYYRSLKSWLVDNQDEIRLRDQIQEICLTMPRYGYRRVTAELRRRNCPVNHKCVLRLMREDNLLCLRKKHWIRTTDSVHGYRTYPNLIGEINLTHPNQLWVADITYVRLVREFVYAAIILDAFSRRVIGWSLSRLINAQLSISALEMALDTRTVMPGLIHHSDQGVQYAATEYINLLKAHSISVSMSRRGNPYDNAMAESFMKTLKYEEVHLNEYETFNDAYENIGRFIDNLYNLKRLHSSLKYKPPIEFENDFYNSHIDNNSFTLTHDSTVSI
jgi:putative transposase